MIGNTLKAEGCIGCYKNNATIIAFKKYRQAITLVKLRAWETRRSQDGPSHASCSFQQSLLSFKMPTA